MKKFNLFQVENTIFDYRFKEIGFGLITLNKVMEHIKDPLRLLKQIKRTLSKSNGIFYVEVSHSVTTKLRPKTDNILGRLHKKLYNIEYLSYIVKKASFGMVECLYIKELGGKSTCCAFTVQHLQNLH